MQDKQQQTNKRTLKIELLSQWNLEAEFRNIISFSLIKHFQLILRLSSVSPGQGLPHVRESDTRQELRNKFGIICEKLSGFVGKLSGCVGILSGFVGKLSAFVGILSC